MMDLLARRAIQPRRPEVLYWRTAPGQEVDLVIETPQRLLPIEVRSSHRVGPGDARAIEAFRDESPDLTDEGLIIHGGAHVFRLTRRASAVPWGRAC